LTDGSCSWWLCRFMAGITSQQSARRHAPLFIVATLMMALKPLLLHQTRATSRGVALPPEQFQLAAEGLKLLICGVVLAARHVVDLPAHLWCGLWHTLSFALPASVYLVMNVLTVRAARMLTPPVFQLVANLKIFCTAVVSWLFLSRKLAPGQWLSMGLLTLGVTLGQWPSGSSDDLGTSSMAGVLLMVLNSCLSALGGVLTETVLKSSASAELSIFATNVHMAVHSMLLNGLALATQTPAELPRLDWRLALAVANEAVNGLLISLLLRRLDSIAKNFAFSGSIFVTAALSAVVLGYWPPVQLLVGATLSCSSVFLFARSASPTPKAAVRKQE